MKRVKKDSKYYKSGYNIIVIISKKYYNSN